MKILKGLSWGKNSIIFPRVHFFPFLSNDPSMLQKKNYSTKQKVKW